MKRKIILWIVAIVLIVISIGVAGYPFISDYVNSLNVEGEAVAYEEKAESTSKSEYETLLENARIYNKSIIGETVISDPFEKTYSYPDDYLNMLKIDDTDVMATISIPKINVNLPIYHGTSTEVLKKGVGHLSSSSLPVGGKGTHAILSGHTGYSSSRLFSDVDQLVEGDVFYITVMKEKLAYKVDQIIVVLPEETDALQIDPEQDYVTLVTCTPFGINTHRLLVRGTRISLEEAAEIESQSDGTESTWDEEYKKAIIAGLILLFIILFVFFLIRFIIRRHKKKKIQKAKLLTESEEDDLTDLPDKGDISLSEEADEDSEI